MQVEYEPARYNVSACVCRVRCVYVCGDRDASVLMHACVYEWLIEQRIFNNFLHYEELLSLHTYLHVHVP